ncbi:BtrH N-terminal domain-containing protein [Propionibacterium sp. oral taxon 192]|uniref:BtrH N-terminal domain-containing protein n=1 Tax=Propionibacterium sp. oral taxon 192 TaxID=671222 RepID=UPI0005697CB3|nr:BtrH N-terminal domain-containing protein [Propionibacterium sp. oral taxon 192]
MSKPKVRRYEHRRGIHCESACQARILWTYGLDIDEDVVFGLDGGFGFTFFPAPGSAPDTVVGKQGILPFKAMRLMGVETTSHAPRTTDGLAGLLEKHLAVLIRVDLGLLPYWGLKGQSSFGGYVINIVSRDGDDFVISDSAFDSLQKVTSGNLQTARSSRSAAPLNPENRAYTFSMPRRAVRLAAIGPVSVRNLCRDVLRSGSRNFGIPGMRQLIKAARAWPAQKTGEQVEDVDARGDVVVVDALERQLLHLGRAIETFGTGGGLYRPIMERYLWRLAEETGDDRYATGAEYFHASGELWSELGQALLAIGEVGVEHSAVERLAGLVVSRVGQAVEIESRALDGLKMV